MLQKCEHFCMAVARLTEALEELAGNPDSSVIRDGVIQRFEFTFELAWKSMKDYMADQGADMSAVLFSKQVFKAAYAAEIISDEKTWLDMLKARNVTSHVYDDKQAADVVAQVRDQFIGPFTALAEFYKGD